MAQMKAIAVQTYGPIENLVPVTLPKPPSPQGHDLLIRVKASSVNPVDTKVRAGIYDDYPDYYERAPSLPQVLGFDGAGTVEAIGPSVPSGLFTPGDSVFYLGSPTRPGANAQFQLVDARSVAAKPQRLDFVEAAALPLTWLTAWEALVERMAIPEGERAGIVIVNGAGGVGSVALQIARRVLRLPVVVATAGRPETESFAREMGATHLVNHREDVGAQVKALELEVPIKYVFITHTPTSGYLKPAAEMCAPFGKVCSIVQDQELGKMYGTEFMAKSLTFVWALVGTKPYYGVDLDSHGNLLRDLAKWIDEGKVQCHLKQRLPLTNDGLRKAHQIIEGGRAIGKVGLGVEVDDLKEEDAFA
ncbi:MAG: hypothetical protein M1821_007110 [Bathelium mastoideum]|nr:MAG: hypothetical protein M1821_007110 [Bathelium mastoideum]